jgi:hypothetical protein
MITAKTVVDKKYWILKQNDKKIGEVEADENGFLLRIQNNVSRFKTIPMLRQNAKIEFEKPPASKKPDGNQVHGYPTGTKPYNPLWDVKLKIPLFTKSLKSKSWFAAGWYAIDNRGTWKMVHNPKLIVLQRYPFQGPFHSREEANDQSIR